MADPTTFWIFNPEIKKSLIQHFGEKLPIIKEMLLHLESEPDIEILRRISNDALSPELVNSTNAAINLLLRTIGQPPEVTKKLRKKFNRLVKGRVVIDLINDVALKTEKEVELLSSILDVDMTNDCVSM